MTDIDTAGTENEVLDTFSPEEKAAMDAMRTGKPVEIEASEPDELETDAPESDDAEPEVEAKDDAPTPEKKKDGRVPLRKLVAEEERRKAVEKELAEQREKWARADERLRTLFEAAQGKQQPPQEKAPPDPTQDPIAAIQYTREQQEQLQRQIADQQRAQQEAEIIRRIDTDYVTHWQNFIAEKPAARQAYDYWVDAMTDHFLFFTGGDKEAATQQVNNLERQIMVAAKQQNANPADFIYRMATSRGFKEAVAESKPDDSAQKIAMRQKAAPAAKSLSSVGGTSQGSTPSALEIANMSDDDYMELRSRIGQRGIDRILGA